MYVATYCSYVSCRTKFFGGSWPGMFDFWLFNWDPLKIYSLRQMYTYLIHFFSLTKKKKLVVVLVYFLHPLFTNSYNTWFSLSKFTGFLWKPVKKWFSYFQDFYFFRCGRSKFLENCEKLPIFFVPVDAQCS